jgi:hypothetical protein
LRAGHINFLATISIYTMLNAYFAVFWVAAQWCTAATLRPGAACKTDCIGGTIRTVCWLFEYCLLVGVVGSKIHDQWGV